MGIKIISRAQAQELRQKNLETYNSLKARLDQIENAQINIENQKKNAQVSSTRARQMVRETKKKMLQSKKQVAKLDRLLAKGMIASQGDKVVLQEMQQ